MLPIMSRKKEELERAAEEKETEERKKQIAAAFSPPVNDLDGGDFVQTWSVMLDGKITTVVLHRNNFQVQCNGDAVLSSIRNSSVETFGPVISFMIGDHRAQISSSRSLKLRNDMTYTLIVDGRFVPTAGSSYDMEERLLRIKWQDKLPDTEVLLKTKIPGIIMLLHRAKVIWAEHVIRMPDKRIPKQLMYGELRNGKRPAGGQKKIL